MNPRYDNTLTQNPSARTYYSKEGYSGIWYTDGDGYERCSSQWVGPCPYCHKELPKPPAPPAEKAAPPKPPAPLGVPEGAQKIYGATAIRLAEDASAAAHAAIEVSVEATQEEEQLQYVKVLN